MKKLLSFAIIAGLVVAAPAAYAENPYQKSAPSAEHQQPAYGGGHSYGGGGERPPMVAEHNTARNYPGFGQEQRPSPPRPSPGYAPQAIARPYGYGGYGSGEPHPEPRPQGDFRAEQHYHDGEYRPPEGYEHREWHHGERLPPVYYGRDYWIGNFWVFGLFAPPPGFEWIRVGGDALLINTYTGEVVQVEYGVFY